MNLQIEPAQSMDLLFGTHVVGFPQVRGTDHARVRWGRHPWLGNADHFCGRHSVLLLRLGHLVAPVPHCYWTSHKGVSYGKNCWGSRSSSVRPSQLALGSTMHSCEKFQKLECAVLLHYIVPSQ